MVACVIAAALALVVATLFHILYNYCPLRHVPGPIFAAFSDLWRVNAQQSSGYGRRLAQLHRKYGKAVRLGPRVISLSDARDIISIYCAKALDELSRHSQGDRPNDQQELFRYEDAVAEAMRDTVRTIRRHRTIDLSTPLRLFTDELRAWFFSSAGLAEPNSRGQTEPSSSFFTTIEEMLLRGPVYILKRDRFSCYGLSGEVSAPVYGHYPVPPQAVYKDADRPDESTVIAASVETIIATLVSVFTFLLDQPRVLRRLRNEIDNMPRFWDRTTVPHSRDFTGAFYLDAVLKETMRLVLLQTHPTGIRIKTGFRDIPLSSIRIPQGTTVIWHPRLILANESIYGNDPAIFRPARWLAVNQRQRACMEKSLVPFTACVPHCPELQAAWLQSKKAVVVLLREFDDIRLLQHRDRDVNSGTPNFLESPRMLVECRPRVARGRGYFGQLA